MDEWQVVRRKKPPREPPRESYCLIEEDDLSCNLHDDTKNDTPPMEQTQAMEISDVGGPQVGRWIPWTKPYPRDSSLFRTPESRALQQVKNAIQQETRWDDFKKITNPYEYIFLSWNRRSSRSVATRQPLSRSYFKMVELWQRAKFPEALAGFKGGLKTAHSAEGPGGFIEACWEQMPTLQASHAITLRSDARNIPGWRKAAKFLTDHPTVHIHEGADGTGNILELANQEAFIETAKGSHLYTADGGFDFSSDYNAQEDSIFPLLLAEFLIGLQVLEVGGCLVVKCFDTMERSTLDLLWVVSRCFAEWSILKPQTSRAGNAERYFIGKGRLAHIDDSIAFLKSIQQTKRWTGPLLEVEEVDQAAWRAWREKVLQFQEELEHIEYTIIRKTLDLIHAHDFSRIRSLVRENVQRSIQWCREFGENISSSWTHDMERNITRETHDLLQIIAPPTMSTFQHHAWYSRNTGISFEGFRRDD